MHVLIKNYMNQEPQLLNDIPVSEIKKMKAFRERVKQARAREEEPSNIFDDMFRATEPEFEVPEMPDLTERSIIEKWPHSLPDGVEVRHGNSRLMFGRFNGPQWKYWREFYSL